MAIPDEPEDDAITQYIICVFAAASRARRYLMGPKGPIPLPLTVADVGAVADAHGTLIPRAVLDAAVFALDADELDAV